MAEMAPDGTHSSMCPGGANASSDQSAAGDQEAISGQPDEHEGWLGPDGHFEGTNSNLGFVAEHPDLRSGSGEHRLTDDWPTGADRPSWANDENLRSPTGAKPAGMENTCPDGADGND